MVGGLTDFSLDESKWKQKIQRAYKTPSSKQNDNVSFWGSRVAKNWVTFKLFQDLDSFSKNIYNGYKYLLKLQAAFSGVQAVQAFKATLCNSFSLFLAKNT